jgi:hypothetical protein
MWLNSTKRQNLQSMDKETFSHCLSGGVKQNHATHHVYVTIGNIHSDFTSQLKLMNLDTIGLWHCNYLPRFQYRQSTSCTGKCSDRQKTSSWCCDIAGSRCNLQNSENMHHLGNVLLVTRTELGQGQWLDNITGNQNPFIHYVAALTLIQLTFLG